MTETITDEEYQNLVEGIAEEVILRTQAEIYESEDEGISDILQSHLYILDTTRAASVVAVSEKTPEGYLGEIHPDDDWKQRLAMMARVCLTKDIRDEVENQKESD